MQGLITIGLMGLLALLVVACNGGSGEPADGVTPEATATIERGAADETGDRTEPTVEASPAALTTEAAFRVLDEQMPELEEQFFALLQQVLAASAAHSREFLELLEQGREPLPLELDWIDACCANNLRELETTLAELDEPVGELQTVYETAGHAEGLALANEMAEQIANVRTMLDKLPNAADETAAADAIDVDAIYALSEAVDEANQCCNIAPQIGE